MDTGILTALMTRILGALTGGQSEMLGIGGSIATSLALIELVWAALMWSFGSGDEALKGFFSKIVKLGIWSLIIFNFPEIVEGIRQLFVHVGMVAAGGGGLPVAVTDPSAVADMGFDAVGPIWMDFKEQDSTLMVGFSIKALVAMLILSFCGLFILMLYYFIALSMFLTVIEFYIVSAFGLVFVPWGINAHTKWIAERYFGALVALGTKLSVQVFMASVTLPVLEKFKLGAEPSFAQTFTLMLGVMAVALLNWRAPNVAAGMMSGAASLSTSDVTAPAMSAAGAAMSAGGAIVGGPAGGAAAGMAAGATSNLSRVLERATSVSGSGSGGSGAAGASGGGLSEAVSAGASTAAGALASAAGVSDPGMGSMVSGEGMSGGASGSSASPDAGASSAPSAPGASSAGASTPQTSSAPALAGDSAPASAPGASSVMVPMGSGTRADMPAVLTPAAAPSASAPGAVIDPGPMPSSKGDK
jgi:type IV secretion system protein TrbL